MHHTLGPVQLDLGLDVACVLGKAYNGWQARQGRPLLDRYFLTAYLRVKNLQKGVQIDNKTIQSTLSLSTAIGL